MQMLKGVETPSIPPTIQRKLDLLEVMTAEELANPMVMLRGGGFKAKKAIADRAGQDIENLNRMVR
jgi:hypothetical protein